MYLSLDHLKNNCLEIQEFLICFLDSDKEEEQEANKLLGKIDDVYSFLEDIETVLYNYRGKYKGCSKPIKKEVGH